MESGTQKTIAKELSFSGIGLHTGKTVNVTLKPAEAGEGINFVRLDLSDKPRIRVGSDYMLSVSRSPRRTSVGGQGAQAHTIEHIMAALYGLGIDNIRIELDREEMPGLDGSSKKYVEMLLEAGVRELPKPRKVFAVKDPIFIEEEGASIAVFPAAELKISYTLDYENPALGTQFLEVDLNKDGVFQSEIAPARTFCLEEEADSLRQQGMGLGANYENTLVVGKSGVVKNKLRFADEFVRHKILDLIGDLYALGCPVKGHVVALRSGHSLNMKLIKKIAQQMQHYSPVDNGSGAQDIGPLDIDMIMKILPHRQPFLLVDRVISLEIGKHAVGIKNVTINDNFFRGHFPGRPVMPGVLIIEAMAQVGGVMMLYPEENRGKLAFFMAIDNVKFRKVVIPGDQLVLDVTAGRIKSKTGQVHGKALVDGKVVAEADLMFALIEE